MIDLSFLRDKPKVVRLGHGVDYLKLYYALKYSFDASYMFESLVLPKQQDRYYTIGFDPLYVFSARSNKLKINGKDEKKEIETKNPYRELKSLLPHIPAVNRYQGGLIGYFSYEAANYFEPALDLEEHPDFPVFEMGLYADGIIYDSETEELEYYTLHEDRSETVRNIIAQLDGLEPPAKIESIESGAYSIEKPEYLQIMKRTLGEIRKGNSFQVE
ncbi:MAG TPA: hypothetical protein VFX86_01225, partial [Candidatus Saccharimonadales bacterium]|nr:hypothetical protein [Candidatus Saccharimonadales bacterium]